MTALQVEWQGEGGLNAAARPLRLCRTCGHTKALHDFSPSALSRGGFRRICRSCRSAQSLAQYHRDPERKRWRALKHRYGMTKEQYDAMLAAQGGVCAVCRDPDAPHRPSDRFKLLHVDHDHETGRIRGLLCYRCNNGIGLLRTGASLRAAADYLEGR